MEADNTHNSNPTSGTTSSDSLASIWMQRVGQADKQYEKWAQKNNCNKLEEYYKGNQWEATGSNYEPYVINLIFSTIEIKIPTLLFENPVFHVKPRPTGYAYDIELAVKRSQLREDLLNTIVSDPLIDFGEEIELAILDAFFRFSVVEVGYSANWITNPNADKPVLRSDSRPYLDSQKNVIKQPKELPESERIYIKRIDPKNFRVGGLEGSKLERCSWCGYWEYQRVEDLKANKQLKNVDKLMWSGARSSDFVPDEYGPEIDSLVSTGDLIKVWHIWDIRSKKRYVFAAKHEMTLYEEIFTRLNLFDLRFHRLPRSWYPLPPVRNWKPAQDEINDSHEQLRNHRKRFTRKFVYNASAFPDEEELDKLINGGDGTWAKTSAMDVRTAVAPVENATLDASSNTSLVLEKDDFNIVSGTSSEQRGVSDRTTATQANIINQKAQIRDSRQRIQVAQWLVRIGREILLLAEEKFTLPVWVKMAVPLSQKLGADLPETSFVWQQIVSHDLKQYDPENDSFSSDFDFEVNISLDSMSPIANDEDRNNFLLFLSLLKQFPEIAADPLLTREAAYKCGYRNEKVIQRMQQAAQLMLMQQLEGNSQSGGNMAQGMAAQNTPPALEEIRNQISGQGIVQ